MEAEEDFGGGHGGIIPEEEKYDANQRQRAITEEKLPTLAHSFLESRQLVNWPTLQMKFSEKVHTALWSDFDWENSFPNKRPLLAHYTSIAVFEQIVTNDEIWFSNPLNMNDHEELRFGMLEGSKEFQQNSELRNAFKDTSTYDQLISHVNRLFEEFDARHVTHTYVMCLSKHCPNDEDGRLSMWRGYGAGGSGIAIVLDTEQIEANQTSPLIIGPVEYATGEERKKWLKEKVNAIAAQFAQEDKAPDDEELFYAAYHWIERLMSFALFTKHIGFKEEDEWRIVYMNQRDPKKIFEEMHGYAITGRGAEPKLKLKLKPLENVFSQNLSLEKIVHKLIVGPTISSALSMHTIKRILEQKGKRPLTEKLRASSIPYRG